MQASLKSEHARGYIKAYWKAYKKDHNDANIKDHLERGTQPYGVCWLNPFEHFKVDTLSQKGGYTSEVRQCEQIQLGGAEIVGKPSFLSTQMVVDGTSVMELVMINNLI